MWSSGLLAASTLYRSNMARTAAMAFSRSASEPPIVELGNANNNTFRPSVFLYRAICHVDIMCRTSGTIERSLRADLEPVLVWSLPEQLPRLHELEHRTSSYKAE